MQLRQASARHSGQQQQFTISTRKGISSFSLPNPTAPCRTPVDLCGITRNPWRNDLAAGETYRETAKSMALGGIAGHRNLLPVVNLETCMYAHIGGVVPEGAAQAGQASARGGSGSRFNSEGRIVHRCWQ